MDWGEAWRLVLILMNDPSSQLAASVGEWDYPVTRADLVIRDLFDLQHRWASAGGKRKKPPEYPRPWPKRDKRRLRPDANLSQERIRDVLRWAGHDI